MYFLFSGWFVSGFFSLFISWFFIRNQFANDNDLWPIQLTTCVMCIHCVLRRLLPAFFLFLLFYSFAMNTLEPNNNRGRFPHNKQHCNFHSHNLRSLNQQLVNISFNRIVQFSNHYPACVSQVFLNTKEKESKVAGTVAIWVCFYRKL